MEDTFEREMREFEKREEQKRLAFLEKGANKVRNDDDLIYRLMALHLSQRFKLGLNWNDEPHDVVYSIVNYYIDNVDEPWEEWLNKDDAPIIKPMKELQRYFPELKAIASNEEEIIRIANSLYNLDIKTDYDGFDVNYFYAYSFDFNSFTPINVKEIKKLKTERCVLAKYGHDTSEIDKQINSFGLTEEQLKRL